MNDHIKSEISAYLAGGLSESRCRQIEAHVAACDKCRQLMGKARAKQARVKRETLKRASSEHITNLFLARQGRHVAPHSPTPRWPWVWLGIVAIGGSAYWLWHHPKRNVIGTPAASTIAVTSSVSTATATTASVPPTATLQHSTTAVPAPVRPPPPPAVPTSPAPPILMSPLPLQEWKGAESAVKDLRMVVIRNSTAWAKLWADMQLSEPLPPVNFDERLIAGVFAGERSAGTSVTLTPGREVDGEWIIPFQVTSGHIALSTTTPTAAGHPYVLGVYSRIDRKIRLTQKEN